MSRLAPRLRRLSVAVAVVAGGSGCGDGPADPEGTLDAVRGDTLRVGVTEAPPWVVRRGREADGVEADLVRRFAESLGAEVEWIWGPAEEHFTALERFDLHLAATGLTASSPWATRVGLTAAYDTTRIVVGVRPGTPGAAGGGEAPLEGRTVGVPPVGGIGALVRKKGARPVPAQDLSRFDVVAAPEHELRALGYHTVGRTLEEQRRVLAAPPGENGFLMALEDVLHEYAAEVVARRLAEPARGGGG